MKKIKIVLAIRSLEIGGAERQFLELAKKINRDKFDVLIITNYPAPLDHEVAGYNHLLLKKSGIKDFMYFIRLAKKLRSFKPDLVYSFMPDMNITMAIVKFISLGSFKLIWGQFGSEPDYKAYAKIRERVYRVQKGLEFLSDGITADGRRGIDFLKKLNYKLRKSIVIYSGSDTLRFYRNPDARAQFRKQYHLNDEDIAIGICSRLDPMKGYLVLAEAAKEIMDKYTNVYFFSIGYGNDEISTRAREILGIHSNRFTWFGMQQHPENFMSGWDIYCSASLYGEGFSNSITEAMSCSLPVIATDIGEAPHQVGNTGKILKPGNAEELAEAIDAWIGNRLYLKLGEQARKRVEENFSSVLMAKNTENFILEVLG